MIWKKQPVGSKLSDLQNNKASKDTATQSAAGLMSAADKTKLDGVATGATAVSVVNNLNSDSTTSALSAAQGKALNSKLAYETVTNWNTFTPSDSTKPTKRQGVSTGGTATGSPFSGDSATFYGEVYGYPSYWTQKLTVQYAATAANQNKQFVRCCINNSTPTAWEEVDTKVHYYTDSNYFSNTTLSAIETILKTKYGSSGRWVTFFNLLSPSDSSPAGYYIALFNSSVSANVRFLCTNSPTATNPLYLEDKIKMNESASVTDADNVNYTGYRLLNGSSCSHLPDNSHYFECFFLGKMQLASMFTAQARGSDCLYIRTYINSAWTPWQRVDKPLLETGTVTQTKTAFQTPYCKKSGHLVDFRYEINGGYTANTTTQIAVLPAGFRPSTHRIVQAITVDSGSGASTGYGQAIIASDGKVTINATTVGFIAVCVTFIAE